MEDKKIILVIETESGLCEEPEITPSKNTKTTVTKDYKKGVQKTIIEIECKPVSMEMLNKKSNRE